MTKLLTPARLAAAIGVLTGLAAAATSLAGALPLGSTQSAIVGAAGVLAQAAVVFKFLAGQASWEATPVGQAQAFVRSTPAKRTEQPAAPPYVTPPFVAAATAAVEAADAEEDPVVDAQTDVNYAPESAGAPDQ